MIKVIKASPPFVLIVALCSTAAFAGDLLPYKDPTAYYVSGFLLLCVAIVLLQLLTGFFDRRSAGKSEGKQVAESDRNPREEVLADVATEITKAASDKEAPR